MKTMNSPELVGAVSIKRIRDGYGSVMEAAMEPLTKKMATIQNNSMKIAMVLPDKVSRVNCMVICPSGHRMYSASNDNSIQIWNTFSNTCTHTLHGHSGSVFCLTISNKERNRLYSGS